MNRNYAIGKLFAVGVFVCGIGYAFTSKQSFLEIAFAFGFLSLAIFFVERLIRSKD